MTSAASRRARSSGSRAAALLALLLLAAGALPAGAATVPALDQLRAARREAVREASAAGLAAGRPAAFALLVVPVDFADARLPDRWDPQVEIGPRLLPASGRTLAGYWRVASRGRLDLQLVVAPTVHLPGRRLDYSDLGFGGDHIRSRRLAREAIEAVAALGLDFRLLDADGPDGLPGTADDDGEVDGVLILHSDPGQENDPENGLIEALQYWLTEPVVSRGTAARFYATASLRSGLGVWAHEVGHLLGLEDRYDPYLSDFGGDAAPEGGLGIFSLMAAGAFGSGGAQDPSLPDAYSAAQLGWLEIAPLRGDGSRADTVGAAAATGRAWRVWTHGAPGPEYFLLESRGGPAAAPFDAAVPPGSLVIYHVDESLPEGQASAATWPRHLRVRLVEADGDEAVARGLAPGGAADVFPGALGVTSLTPESVPSSDGYAGPTGIRLTEIAAVPGGVSLRVRDREGPAAGLAFGFAPAEPRTLALAVTELGDPWTELTATVSVEGPSPWGNFDGALEVELPLQRGEDGTWRPATPAVWRLAATTPAGSATAFTVALEGDGWRSEFSRRWVWLPAATPLDFAAGLPPDWQVLDLAGEPATTWHHWANGGGATGDGAPVLACTGTAFADGGAWPEVAHAGRADVVLVTGPLPAGTAAVRLLHHWHADAPVPGVSRDGGVLELELADGSIVPLSPLDGYGGRIDPGAANSLHDRPAFVGADPLVGGRPLAWRLDVVPLPPTEGPARLRLRFASDPFDAGRGWLVADLAAVVAPAAGAAFPLGLVLHGGGLRLSWEWPWEGDWGGVDGWTIERSADAGVLWEPVWSGTEPGAAGLPRSVDAELLTVGAPRGRLLLRVVAETARGRIASRPLLLPLDGGPDLSLAGPPYPNPADGEVRMLIDLPPEAPADLRIVDLRGRVLRSWRLEGGRRLWRWDGLDGEGRRVAAGSYLLRLEADGRTVTRKVVLR